MPDNNSEFGVTSAGLAMSFATGGLFAVAYPLGLLAGALLRHVWPEPSAPLLVFGALWSVVFIGVEIARWNHAGRLRLIYLTAIGLYFFAGAPLIDALRDLMLGARDTNGTKYVAVTAMSLAIVVGSFCLLLRASFTREEERAIRMSFARDLPASSREASTGQGT